MSIINIKGMIAFIIATCVSWIRHSKYVLSEQTCRVSWVEAKLLRSQFLQ